MSEQQTPERNGVEPEQQTAERNRAELEQQQAPEDNRAEPESDALEKAKTRIAQLEDNWRRVAAELDNFRKRCAKDLVRAREQERARTAAAWLPVVDSLERALEHASADPDQIIEGVRAVYQQALSVLADLGFPKWALAHSEWASAHYRGAGQQVASPDWAGTLTAVHAAFTELNWVQLPGNRFLAACSVHFR